MLNPAEVWESDRLSDRLLRWSLVPGSWLYGLGWEGYLALYRLGFKKAAEPHKPVLVIGNLVVGGSGKSPLTRHVVELLTSHRPVVIGCSGYGSPRSVAATLAPAGPLDPSEWGDEPAMLRWFLPDVPIVVGRRRVLAAEIVAREHPDAVLVMDDGFQHLPLKKHVSILLDPERPRNTHCLPAGPYREPRFERNRADLVLGERFKVVKEPLRFVSGLSGETMKVKEAGVLCALGRPQGFLQDLDATGMRITGHRLLHDHDPLVAGTILDGLSGQGPIVVTAKDWVKLRQRSDLDLTRFVVALQKISVQPSDEFEAWLKERLAH